MQKLKQHIFSGLTLLTCLLFITFPSYSQARSLPEASPSGTDSTRRSFQLSISKGLVSLHAEEADVARILEEISKGVDINIKIAAPLEKKISVSFENLPLTEALEKMTSNRGMVFSRRTGEEQLKITRVVVFPGSGGHEPVRDDAHDTATFTSPRITDGPPERFSFRTEEASSPNFTLAVHKSGKKYKIVANELIVRFKQGISESEIRSLLAQIGASIKNRIQAIGYYVLSLPVSISVTEALSWFQEQRMVDKAEPNYLIPLQQEPTPLPDDEFFQGYQWTFHNTGQTGGPENVDVDALEAWGIEQGTPQVVIAIIDTGIDYNHPDLGANIWQNDEEARGEDGIDDEGNGYVDDTIGWDFVDDDNDPMDEHGHGTHVGGIAGAVTDNGIGVAGLARLCQIMPVRAGDAAGIFTSEDAAQAIIYAAQNEARVINLSWGGYEKISLIDEAMTFATDEGALICAASGNDDSSNLVYPAAYRNNAVIAVGATDHQDNKASFSNYGDWVHVSAPGDGPALGDSSLRGIYSTHLNGSYRQLRGTSMATPHVAGAAALLFSRFQDMSPLEAKTQIMRSVDVLPALQGLNMTSGRINAHRALSEEYHTPYIFSIRPDAAHEQDRVSILGDRFGENQMDGSAVDFYPGLEAEIVTWTDSAIVCRVPEGAQTGEMAVTTGDGMSNGVLIAILASYYEEELLTSRFGNSGTPMAWHADDRSWAHTLPFSFPFFGIHHDTVSVCSNGFLVFEDDGFKSYDNTTNVLKTKAMIAPLWDDLVTTGSSGDDIYIDSPSPDAVSFRWAGKRYGSTDPVNVEAVLYDDGRIEFNYGPGNDGLSPTIGISGGDGSQYHLSVHDGNSSLGEAQTVLFTPLNEAPQTPECCLFEDGGDSDCFIATAAFGSPFEEHVCTLRAFRDQYLADFGFGRRLILMYERLSPPLARFIAEHRPLQPLVRGMLLPWVAVSYAMVSWGAKASLCILAATILAPCLLVFFSFNRRLQSGAPRDPYSPFTKSPSRFSV